MYSCFYFLKTLLHRLTVKFKKRKSPFASTPKLVFGELGLFTLLQFRFEAVYFRILNRVLRKKYRKRNIAFCKQKYWIRFSKNIFLSKKAKNARMGSGKGKFLRPAFSLAANKPFIETRNFNQRYLAALAKRLTLKIPIKLIVLGKNYLSNFIK